MKRIIKIKKCSDCPFLCTTPYEKYCCHPSFENGIEIHHPTELEVDIPNICPLRKEKITFEYRLKSDID